MSYDELENWKRDLVKLQDWLKRAASSPGTRHQVPNIKKEIEFHKKNKPKGGSSRSKSSGRSSGGGFKFSLNPLTLLWNILKWVLKFLWNILRGMFKA
jgi:hypothetical protein